MSEDTHPVDIWGLLEAAPAGCEGVASLYSWSLNYDGEQSPFDGERSPFLLFLDLIGWSDEHFGGPMFQLREGLGYRELQELAGALSEYAAQPHDVSDYVDALMVAEQ